ncbi:MAG: ABC transporter permease [Candidatus Micrarchaeota archaeon]|nr:ABC transporter permease [Candidatus Micrarchaeota archaeon]
MAKIISVIKKEIQEISHDRTMMIILFMFPIFIMLFMGSSFRSMEISGLPIGITGAANATFTEALFSEINQSHAFNIMRYDSEDDAMNAFRNGQLHAVIVVPENFDEMILQGNGSEVRLLVDNSDLSLEQAMLTAMSAVIQASSANITQSYVYSAWDELKDLNSSASMLRKELNVTKGRMQETKATLAEVRGEIDSISISSLEGTLDNASAKTAGLQGLIVTQRSSLSNASSGSAELFAQSDAFIANASDALNESMAGVDGACAKIDSETANLTETRNRLDSSIAGLEMIRDATSDATVIAALDLNIASLQSLRNSTAQQIIDMQQEKATLSDLNMTLNGTYGSLSNYSMAIENAKIIGSSLKDTENALDSASVALSGLNDSFSSARTQVSALGSLLSSIRNTSSQIEDTLDAAMAQAGSVENLIATLESTVAEQTAKDPKVIASPLSVKVENQYSKASFVDFVMPQVIAVSLLFSCFLLGSISIVREKTRKTIVRALLAPSALANLVAGKIATLVLISFGQVALILIVASLLFGVSPPMDWGILLWGTMISSLVLSSIGVLVGFYARSESSAIQGCLLIAIPMLFLGNIVFSPELLPVYTQILQQALPLAHITNIFKIVLITGGSPGFDVAALISYFILLSIILLYVIITRRDISNYS